MQDQTPVIQGIVDSGADWTFLTTNPSIGAEILGGAVAGRLRRHVHRIASPTYDFRLSGLGCSSRCTTPTVLPVGLQRGRGASARRGNDEMMAAMREAFPDRRPLGLLHPRGWNESITMQHVCSRRRIANGDLTRAGVVAAANSLETVDFGGSAPNQSYAGAPNDYVVRESAVFDPDLATYTAAGGTGAEQTLSQDDATTGSLLKKDFFV